jgi:hypothetical protein
MWRASFFFFADLPLFAILFALLGAAGFSAVVGGVADFAKAVKENTAMEMTSVSERIVIPPGLNLILAERERRAYATNVMKTHPDLLFFAWA